MGVAVSMNPDRKPGKREYRARADHGKGLQFGEDGTQINHFHEPNKAPAVLIAVLFLLVAGGAAVVLLADRGTDGTAASKGDLSQPVPVGSPIAPTTPAVTTAKSTTPAAIWYDLTKYRAVIWNNGFDPVDPVRIGAASYPAGIVGSYQSSSTDQNDKAVWALGGRCTSFEASVGKNTDSSGGGTGRFVVIGDDRELFSAEVGPNDPAAEVRVDITGVIRLTLFDTRRLQDATNAWGRPRVLCATAPGTPR